MAQDSGNGYEYTDLDFYDEENKEQELHRIVDLGRGEEGYVPDPLFVDVLTALLQEPGTHVRVYWEDSEGLHFGIPTPEQIASPSHRRLAEIAYHVD